MRVVSLSIFFTVAALVVLTGFYVAESQPPPVTLFGVMAFVGLSVLVGVVGAIAFVTLQRVVMWAILAGPFRPEHWAKTNTDTPADDAGLAGQAYPSHDPV